MKRPAIILISICAVVVAALAVTVYRPMVSLWFDLALLNEAAPEKDAAIALTQGQPRCFSVNGYARSFPGVEGENARAFCERNERNFSGTSDIIVGPWHADLQHRAIAYARAYNRHVLVAKVVAK